MPSFEIQFNLAECAFVRGDYQLAKERFKNAVEISSSNPTYHSIAAFKVIVSAGLNDEAEMVSEFYSKNLTSTGRHYLEIVRSVWDRDISRVTELLKSPKNNSSDSSSYIDTLRTSGILPDGK